MRLADRIHAFAKINLTLRVLGVRPDRFHELRTVFQTVALHDTLVLETAPGPFRIVCSDPACPSDERNLVWRAAEALARRAGRRRALHGLRVRITKRIPLESGLGGGSSDAAAALRLFARVWKLRLAADDLREIAASIGADVPFFLDGGTALGIGRGDRLFALADLPPLWVVIVVPPFGVSTREAYGWWDAAARRRTASARGVGPERSAAAFARQVDSEIPAEELRNDLASVVVAHRPEIGRIIRTLARDGAAYAAMSGSGSAVFGLFRARAAAAAAVAGRARSGRRVLLTRTVARPEAALRGN